MKNKRMLLLISSIFLFSYSFYRVFTLFKIMSSFVNTLETENFRIDTRSFPSNPDLQLLQSMLMVLVMGVFRVLLNLAAGISGLIVSTGNFKNPVFCKVIAILLILFTLFNLRTHFTKFSAPQFLAVFIPQILVTLVYLFAARTPPLPYCRRSSGEQMRNLL